MCRQIQKAIVQNCIRLQSEIFRLRKEKTKNLHARYAFAVQITDFFETKIFSVSVPVDFFKCVFVVNSKVHALPP
jgi:hypothetical protein